MPWISCTVVFQVTYVRTLSRSIVSLRISTKSRVWSSVCSAGCFFLSLSLSSLIQLRSQTKNEPSASVCLSGAVRLDEVWFFSRLQIFNLKKERWGMRELGLYLLNVYSGLHAYLPTCQSVCLSISLMHVWLKKPVWPARVVKSSQWGRISSKLAVGFVCCCSKLSFPIQRPPSIKSNYWTPPEKCMARRGN